MSTQDFIYGADTANMEAGGKSFFDEVGDALTAGVAGAAVSGLASIYNTGVEVSNKVFGTEADKIDVTRTLEDVHENWGKYYTEHQGVLDTAGFIAGSFIPGGLAIKGLKALRAGESAGAFKSVLGYASSREASYLGKALDDIAAEGGTVFARINTNKLISMGYGAADQVLQAAVFETAAALTMNQSPILEKEDWKDISMDIVKTSLAGGVLGGGIGAIFTQRITRDASKAVDAAQRKYDVLAGTHALGLSVGDKAFAAVDAAMAVPKELLEADSKLAFKYKLGGESYERSLATGPLLDRARQKAIDAGYQKFEATITNAFASDTSVGKSVAEALLGVIQQGKTQKLGDEEIRSRLGDYLFNLKAIEGVGSKPTDLSKEIVFFNPKAKITENPESILSSARPAILDDKTMAFRMLKPLDDKVVTMTLGKEALTIKQAIAAGADMIIDPAKRTMHINPASSYFQKISTKDATDTVRFMNTRTGQTSDTTIPTIADVATTNVPLKVTKTGVVSGDSTFSFTPGTYNPDASSVEATARHLWSSQLSSLKGKIDADDVSLMEALLRNPKIADKELIVGETKFSDIGDFEKFWFNRKLDLITDEFVRHPEGAGDIRAIAYKYNVEAAWLEKAIATKFDAAALGDEGWSRPLFEGKDAIATYGKRENVILRYDTDTVDASANTVSATVAFAQRVKLAQQKNADAAAAVLGRDGEMLLDKMGSITNADGTGVGATLFGAANANLNDPLRVAVQSIGSTTAKIIEKRVALALEPLQTPAQKVLQNPKVAAEIVAATTKGRLSTDNLSLFYDPAGAGKFSLVDTVSFKKFSKTGEPAFKTAIPLSNDAGEFLRRYHEGHKDWIANKKVLANAQGVPLHWDPDALYFPPVNTQKIPFFAFVRPKEGKIFGDSDVAMLTARDANELNRLAGGIGPDFDVIFKKDTEAYHKAKGDYEFARTMNSPKIDSSLRSQGKLGNYLPSFTPESIIEEFISHVQRRESALVRDSVSVKYAQEIAELQHLSAVSTGAATSKFEGARKFLDRTISDPYGDYIKTALNLSKRSEFTLLHQANEFVDALGTRAYRVGEQAFIDARDKKISWEEANNTMERYGLGRVFKDEHAFAVAQNAQDRNIIKSAVNKANMLLATATLRLDFINSAINTISTPIMMGMEVSSIRNSLKNDPQLLESFNRQMMVDVPGQPGVQIPSTMKLMMNGIKAWWSPEKQKLFDRYAAIGAIKDPKSLFHEMIDDVSLLPKLVPSEYAAKVDKWVEKGASITFNNQAENFTRFWAANVMHQITEPVVAAGKMSEKEQNAFISIFVNRVQGNYVASQRPILFQGTLGSAIGLFQTYQFNLLQQVFRHIENRDWKTLAVGAGLQSSVYGLNGLPLFEAINTHLIGNASINEGHTDAYSGVVKSFGKDWGDWLLYGTGSAFPLFGDKAPALYTRGDVNPRHVTIIPTSPLDVPAVQASLKVVSNLVDMGVKLANGSPLAATLLTGLEHNGVSRPLAGLAQVAQGFSTTSKGDLISTNSDFLSIASASRILGAKPMDESVGLNTLYRLNAYKAKDKERTEILGSVIKDKLRNGQQIDPDELYDFQAKYTAAGGRIQGYSAALQRWSRNSNTSIVNQLAAHHNNMAGQRLLEAMGGDPLPDFRNAEPVLPEDQQQQQQ